MRRRITLITLSLLAVTLLGGALFLPRLAAPMVERALPATLARAGATASWSALELSWTGRVRLSDVHIEHEGLATHLEAAEIALKASPFSLLTKTPELTSLQVRNAALTIDDPGALRRHLQKLRGADGASTESPTPANPGAGATGGLLAAPRVAHLLNHLPDVAINRLTLDAGEAYPALAMALNDVALQSGGDSWEVGASVELPALLRPFATQAELAIAGEISPLHRLARLDAGGDSSPALSLAGPAGATVEVARVTLDAGAQTLTLSEVNATLSRGPLEARAELPALHLSPGTSTPLRAELERPRV
ncbi:hypothetical protein FRC96_16785, partial [Lujinxingia vulgaris]